jgi:hypothetical protein
VEIGLLFSVNFPLENSSPQKNSGEIKGVEVTNYLLSIIFVVWKELGKRDLSPLV